MRMDNMISECVGYGDSNGKGDRDWKNNSQLLYKIKKSFHHKIFNSQDDIVDYHTVVITNVGEANKKDVDIFLQNCIYNYNLQNNDNIQSKWKINLIVDKRGVRRGIAYVYLQSSEFFNILVGNFKDGSRRVTPIENPYFDVDIEQNYNYKNFCFKQENYIYVPNVDPLFKIPTIIPEQSGIEVVPHVVPYHINAITKTNILFCNRVPFWVTEEMIRRKLSILGERNVFINIVYNNKNYNSVYILFPSNMKACFSLIMLKRIRIKNEYCRYTLFFRLLK